MAIKRARHLALLPYAPEHIYRQGDVASLGTPKSLKETAAEKEVLAAAAETEVKETKAEVEKEKEE
jgi:hypothetical protein